MRCVTNLFIEYVRWFIIRKNMIKIIRLSLHKPWKSVRCYFINNFPDEQSIIRPTAAPKINLYSGIQKFIEVLEGGFGRDKCLWSVHSFLRHALYLRNLYRFLSVFAHSHQARTQQGRYDSGLLDDNHWDSPLQLLLFQNRDHLDVSLHCLAQFSITVFARAAPVSLYLFAYLPYSLSLPKSGGALYSARVHTLSICSFFGLHAPTED